MQNSFKKVQEIHDLWPSKFQILIQKKEPTAGLQYKDFCFSSASSALSPLVNYFISKPFFFAADDAYTHLLLGFLHTFTLEFFLV